MNVFHLLERPLKLFKGETIYITFTKEDVKGVHHLHSDALVITISIKGLNVHRIPADNGSSVNLLAYNTY